jgi:hypothetical protein
MERMALSPPGYTVVRETSYTGSVVVVADMAEKMVVVEGIVVVAEGMVVAAEIVVVVVDMVAPMCREHVLAAEMVVVVVDLEIVVVVLVSRNLELWWHQH